MLLPFADKYFNLYISKATKARDFNSMAKFRYASRWCSSTLLTKIMVFIMDITMSNLHSGDVGNDGPIVSFILW